MVKINPTIFYIGLIVLILAAMVGVYFKIIPLEIVLTLIGVLVGHGVTVVTHVVGDKSP
jgi:hypothetical protein